MDDFSVNLSTHWNSSAKYALELLDKSASLLIVVWEETDYRARAKWNENVLSSTSPSSPTVTPVLSGVSLDDYSFFVVSSASHSGDLTFLWGGCHFLGSVT